MRVEVYHKKEKFKFWLNRQRRKLKWAWRRFRYPNCIWVSGCKFHLPVHCDNCGDVFIKAEQDACTVSNDGLLLCPFCAEIINENESRRVSVCDNIMGYE